MTMAMLKTRDLVEKVRKEIYEIVGSKRESLSVKSVFNIILSKLLQFMTGSGLRPQTRDAPHEVHTRFNGRTEKKWTRLFGIKNIQNQTVSAQARRLASF
jgi:hypothetical protein